MTPNIAREVTMAPWYNHVSALIDIDSSLFARGLARRIFRFFFSISLSNFSSNLLRAQLLEDSKEANTTE